MEYEEDHQETEDETGYEEDHQETEEEDHHETEEEEDETGIVVAAQWHNIEKKWFRVYWKCGNSKLLPFTNIRHLPSGFIKRLMAAQLQNPAPKIYVHVEDSNSGKKKKRKKKKGTGGPLRGADTTQVIMKHKSCPSLSVVSKRLVPFIRNPGVEPDRFFPAERAYCLKKAMDHILADSSWCSISDLQRGKYDVGEDVIKGGYWSMSSVRRTLKNIQSPIRLLCRRKSPYFLCEPDRLLVVESGMYIVIGHDAHGKVSHAIGVDANRRPRVMFSGCHVEPIPLTRKNLNEIRFPVTTITDVSQVMIQID